MNTKTSHEFYGAIQDPRSIPALLREKYDVRGPRYTSYPPANHFHHIEQRDVFKLWQARNHHEDDQGLSLYAHIPFCKRRCLFCGCYTSITRNASQADDYLDALMAESVLIQNHVSSQRPVHQIALGGGTPNFLHGKQLDVLLHILTSQWVIDEQAELSAELDPRTVNSEQLDVLLRYGFNRISLGVQDFNPQVIEHIRSGHSEMKIEEVAAYLRSNELTQLNIDLIYGLPGQTPETGKYNIERILHLRPSRIAFYSYAHLPHMFKHQQVLEKKGLPSAEEKSRLFTQMTDALLDAGYLSIGMDHFALPEDGLVKAFQKGSLRRNFMGYTTGRALDIVALGASAISAIGNVYAQNEKDLQQYRQQIQQERIPIVKGFILNHDDQLRRALIMDLFCNFNVDLKQLGLKYSIEPLQYFAALVPQLNEMVDDGLLTYDSQGIQVSQVGRFFIRNICMMFDSYLQFTDNQKNYSRTI